MKIRCFDWKSLKIGDIVFVRFTGNNFVTLCKIVDKDKHFYNLSRDVEYGNYPIWYAANVDFNFAGVKS